METDDHRVGQPQRTNWGIPLPSTDFATSHLGACIPPACLPLPSDMACGQWGSMSSVSSVRDGKRKHCSFHKTSLLSILGSALTRRSGFIKLKWKTRYPSNLMKNSVENKREQKILQDKAQKWLIRGSEEDLEQNRVSGLSPSEVFTFQSAVTAPATQSFFPRAPLLFPLPTMELHSVPYLFVFGQLFSKVVSCIYAWTSVGPHLLQ